MGGLTAKGQFQSFSASGKMEGGTGRGPTGPAGATGPAGPTGPTGPTGPSGLTTHTFEAVFNGMGTPLVAGTGSGQVVYIPIPYIGTIQSYQIAMTPAGNVQFDIWKANAAIPTVANTIVGNTNPPAVTDSSGIINSSTLTGWSPSVAANDIVAISISSVTVGQFVCVKVVY